MVHHLTPKKAHINRSNFFQNPYCWFILEHFWTSLTKSTTLPGDINNFLFQSTMGMSGIPGNAKKNFMIKLQLPQISYYMPKANFLPQIVFEILKFKILFNSIGLECFQLQLFYTAMLFLQVLKCGVSFKTKKLH